MRAIREECLESFNSVRGAWARRASMRPGARTSGAADQGLGNEGRSGLPTDPGRARDGPPLGPEGA